MKKSMLITLALLAFAMGSFYASAATVIAITDNNSSVTHYSDMPTAEAAFVAGNTMDIQDFDGPLPWAGNCPSWVTVKCSKANSRATLQGKNLFGALDHTHLFNLIIDGQDSMDGSNNGGAEGFNTGANSTMNNCMVTGFWWNEVFLTAGSMTNGVQDPGTTFTYCTFVSNGTCVDFTNQYISASATQANTMVFDHCSFMTHAGECLRIEGNYDGLNLNQIFKVTNSIISDRYGAVGIVYGGASPVTPATDVNEDYNCFDCFWNAIYSQGGGTNSPPVGKHSFQVDYRNFKDANADFFANYGTGNSGGLNGNVTLNATAWPHNICVAVASDGTNIGADVTTVPVELSAFSVQ